MHDRLAVNIKGLKLRNPVIAASGTFGYGEEFRGLVDLRKLGAIVSKTITLKARRGNPVPRTAETPAGLLNSIGLENPGLEGFLDEKLPILKKIGIPIIVSIASEAGKEEFVKLAKELDNINAVAAIELNISCPNIKDAKSAKPESLPLIAQDAAATYELVRAVRTATRKPLITKLSPNVSSIGDIARSAERAGSDAVSLINTITAMSIDVETRKPRLAAVTGGLSGPAVRPVAVRMVWEVYRRIKIPIIGMGGIMKSEDALEFIIAGASAVSIGTANFINPRVSVEIIEGIKKYLQKNNLTSIQNLIGSLECKI